MLPTDASSVTGRALQDFDAPMYTLDEKQFVITLLRLFFGPAKGAVQDVSSPSALRELGALLRTPGERFEILERDTSLPAGYFSGSSPRAAGLYGAKLEALPHPSKYFIYGGPLNLTCYVGPDFLHGVPDAVTINCVLLNLRFEPTESHTLR
ncbi:hypothetical protein [Nocardia abscessus]|uniref:hypothetical protein n=1 Tax=Nocardia abscessus TaxID=120957 RepID=UPI0005BD3060|nr:hypothetical protein [Nocardia abscessus]MCC3328270.1 hypothetical protein [Nocardia abscessus]